MPQVSCPQCGQTYNITDESWPQYAGRSIACTRCGRQFPVDAGLQAAATPAPRADVANAPVGVTPHGGYGFGGATPFAPPKPNPMAVWALVLGCLSFFLSAIAGLPAIVLGVLGMKRARDDPQVGGKGLALTGMILGIAGTVLTLLPVLVLLPALNRARDAAMRVKCANSMRQIGLGLMLYSNDNRGSLPDSLDALVKGGYETSGLPECPAHAARAAGAAGAPPASPPGYVYVGQGMNLSTISAPGSVVLLYEQPAHGGGINVLYADVHVEYFTADRAPRLVADLEKGVNPPTVTGGK